MRTYEVKELIKRARNGCARCDCAPMHVEPKSERHPRGWCNVCWDIPLRPQIVERLADALEEELENSVGQ